VRKRIEVLQEAYRERLLSFVPDQSRQEKLAKFQLFHGIDRPTDLFRARNWVEVLRKLMPSGLFESAEIGSIARA
jgi:hypothetical protein